MRRSIASFRLGGYEFSSVDGSAIARVKTQPTEDEDRILASMGPKRRSPAVMTNN